MNLLILGGTVFLGPHLVELALEKGHHVTLFNRGHHEITFSRTVEQILGDRNGDLSVFRNRNFDAIIDTSNLDPKVVKMGLETLQKTAPHYTYISSISVYQDFLSPKTNEAFPLLSLSDSPSENGSENYGLRKSFCEREVTQAFPDRAFIVRPGLIIGRYDPTDRFTYWVNRIKKGGRVLLPMMAQKKIQEIDVRDLAQWIITSIEKKTTGIFNAIGPSHDLSFGELVAKISFVTKSQFEPVWVPDSFLLEKGLKEWTDLPLWIAENNAPFRYFMDIDHSKAFHHGLSIRPIEETIQDISLWDDTRSYAATMKAGITLDNEQSLLSQFFKDS